MYGLILFLHLVICLALIGVVLIQSGKGGGLAGGAFGGSAQTVFGGRGATDIVTRSTMILGGLFFVTSMVLALMTTGQRGPTRSIVQEEAKKTAATAPPNTPIPGNQANAPGAGASPGAGAAPQAPTSGAPAGGTTPAPTTAPAPSTPPGGGR